MYEKTYAPALNLKGYKGDATYQYVYARIINPNVEPEDIYYVLRIRKIEFGGDPAPYHALPGELADLYSWGFYNLDRVEYGHLRVEGGIITKLIANGSEKEGVYFGGTEPGPSRFDSEIRTIFKENRPAIAPKEPPMKYRAVVDYTWLDGSSGQWRGPERDTGEEAAVDMIKASFKPDKPYSFAVPEIESYPASDGRDES